MPQLPVPTGYRRIGKITEEDTGRLVYVPWPAAGAAVGRPVIEMKPGRLSVQFEPKRRGQKPSAECWVEFENGGSLEVGANSIYVQEGVK